MALTTTWKGQLKISLISFPVWLYAAVGSAKKLALNQLHKQCRSRIHLDTFCPKHGKLARSEITKGYEYERGKYITVEQEDLEKIKLESTRTIESIQFVNQTELDPVYIDAAYYVAPDGPVAQEAFRIVHKAMHKMKKVGIGQITMHNREYLVALKAYQKGFLLIRLHYAQELRNPKACFEDITDGQVPKDQLQGTTENSVKTQIWIAISVYVLVAIIKKELKIELSLSEILQILSITLFEKFLITEVLTKNMSQNKNFQFHNQLLLFNL